MLKCYPAAAVEEKIRKQAADLNIPITQYLAPFLAEIAAGRIKLVPQAQQPAQKVA